MRSAEMVSNDSRIRGVSGSLSLMFSLEFENMFQVCLSE